MDGRTFRRNRGAVVRVTIAVVWSAVGVVATVVGWVPAEFSAATPFVIASVPLALLVYSEYRHVAKRPDVRVGKPVRGGGQVEFSPPASGVRRLGPSSLHVPIVWRLPIENHGPATDVQVQLVRVEPPDIVSNHPLHFEGDDPADGVSYKRTFTLVDGQTEHVNVVAMTSARPGEPAVFFVCTTKAKDAVLRARIDGSYTFFIRVLISNDAPLDGQYRVDIDRTAGSLEMVAQ